MSSIIKSIAVVDDRQDPEALEFHPERELPVIKRQILAGACIGLAKPPPTRDSLLDELNRLKVRVAQADQELQEAERQRDALRTEIEILSEQRAALEGFEELGPDEKARAILQDAEQKAEQILTSAALEASDTVEQLKAQGYIDGLEQGANEARAGFQQENEPKIRMLEQIITELSGMKDEMLEQSESDIITLILSIAEKIVGKQLSDSPETVADMLRGVMEQNRRETFIKVTLSPDLLPAEAKASDAIRRKIESMGAQVDTAVDPHAEPATLLVETPGGYTDLSIGVQLSNIESVLREQRAAL